MSGGNNISAIDLFCGIGGLTKGLESAGIKVEAGFDIDESCRFAYQSNNHAKFIKADVAQLDSKEVIALYPSESIKVLVGCAPCQPFSKYTLRYRKNGQPDDKWKLLNSFLRLIKEVQPEVISMENVPQLLEQEIFVEFKDHLQELKYNVSYQIAFCPDYGVPQNRKRLVLLASKLGEISLIPPIYNPNTYKTVRTAIGDLPPLKAGEANNDDPLHVASALSETNMKRIKMSVPGGTWGEWQEDLKLKCHKKFSGRGYRAVYGRMEWDKPSPTITTQFYGVGNGRFGHPEQDRALSLREGALLQSFPMNYIFFDQEHYSSKRELGLHIGNAVPVLLGKAIGKSILEHIEQYKRNLG